jgi:hypothetical protein
MSEQGGGVQVPPGWVSALLVVTEQLRSRHILAWAGGAQTKMRISHKKTINESIGLFIENGKGQGSILDQLWRGTIAAVTNIFSDFLCSICADHITGINGLEEGCRRASRRTSTGEGGLTIEKGCR